MSGDRIEPTGRVPAYVPGEPRRDEEPGSRGKRKRAAGKKKKKKEKAKYEPAAVPKEPTDEDPSEPPHLVDYRAAGAKSFQSE